ncbi:lipase member K-like [Oratosquilla oratoria]|uniref:lipase member K-like n=1 Tax=Oratosquilla oratoria TaxID=337810 RepID=UPI003F7648A2
MGPGSAVPTVYQIQLTGRLEENGKISFGLFTRENVLRCAKPEVIRLSGYPLEVHNVVTEDGYILELFRIPSGRGTRTSGEPRQPVLLQHGLLASSSTWVLQEEPEKNLPMLLADDGYDVWLANSRGSEYSQRHFTLATDDPRFWQFSFDQMGRFDLPATVDYILEQTPKDDLLFVGFSMGSRILTAMLNEFPEYNNKIRVWIGLAATFNLRHVRGVHAELSTVAPFLQEALEVKGVHKIDFRQPFIRAGIRLACLWVPLCLDLYASSGPGVDVNKVGMRVLGLFAYAPVALPWTPSGHGILSFEEGRKHAAGQEFLRVQLNRGLSVTSLTNYAHYAQLIRTGQFTKFDFGASKNREVYGQDVPPEYRPDVVQVPAFLFSGTKDYQAFPEDGASLAASLPALVCFEIVRGYNHFDFVTGAHAEQRIYQRVMDILKAYS